MSEHEQPVDGHTIGRGIFETRLARLRAALAAADLDAAVVYAAPRDLGHATATSGNVHYLTGWTERTHPCALVITPWGAPLLVRITSALDRDLNATFTPWVERVRSATSPADLGVKVCEALAGSGRQPGRVGLIGGDEMYVSVHRALADSGFEFVPADQVIVDLKRQKSPEEVARHRVAAATSDAMIAAAFARAATPGVWLHEVMAQAEYTGRSLGAEYAAVWVTSGRAPSQVAHHIGLAKHPLEPGGRVQVGTYVVQDGYWGHAIRMANHGPPDPALEDAVAAVCDVQDAGLAALRPGASLTEVVATMEARAAKHSPYADVDDDHMRVRFGHVLGLQYSEPVLSAPFPVNPGHPDPGTPDVAVHEGMIIELHPNLGFADLGWVAVGDMAVVTPAGAEFITQFPRRLHQF